MDDRDQLDLEAQATELLRAAGFDWDGRPTPTSKGAKIEHTRQRKFEEAAQSNPFRGRCRRKF